MMRCHWVGWYATKSPWILCIWWIRGLSNSRSNKRCGRYDDGRQHGIIELHVPNIPKIINIVNYNITDLLITLSRDCVVRETKSFRAHLCRFSMKGNNWYRFSSAPMTRNRYHWIFSFHIIFYCSWFFLVLEKILETGSLESYLSFFRLFTKKKYKTWKRQCEIR